MWGQALGRPFGKLRAGLPTTAQQGPWVKPTTSISSGQALFTDFAAKVEGISNIKNKSAKLHIEMEKSRPSQLCRNWVCLGLNWVCFF